MQCINLTNSKSKVTLYIFAFLFVFISGESFYLAAFESMKEESLDKKNTLTQLIGLPDLALSSQDGVLRHRSLGDIFTLYKDAPTLRESSSTSFVVNHFNHTKGSNEE